MPGLKPFCANVRAESGWDHKVARRPGLEPGPTGILVAIHLVPAQDRDGADGPM
jgi:hypothetical protein